MNHDAARAACIQRAYARAAGIEPGMPGNPLDIAGCARRQHAVDLATRMFDRDRPNLQRIGEIVNKMTAQLAPGAKCRVAGAGDRQCGTRSDYGSFGPADSWARYVHCVSDQSAEKPEVIKGKTLSSLPGRGGQAVIIRRLPEGGR